MKRKFYVIAIGSLLVLAPSAALADVSTDTDSADVAAAKLSKLQAKGDQREQASLDIISEIQSGGSAAVADELSGKKQSKLHSLVNSDKKIPKELMDKAQCVVVIPGDKQLGFAGFGANYGAGISECRDADGNLGNPHFVKLEGGSYGFQIGYQTSDKVLLFMNKDAAQSLSKGSVKVGAEASAAAGPYGRNLSAGTDVNGFKDQIISYSRSGGLYAGLTLNGQVLVPDKKMEAAEGGQELPKSENIFKRLAGLFHHKKKSDDVAAAADQSDQASDALNLAPAPSETAGVASASIDNVKPMDSVAAPSAQQPVQQAPVQAGSLSNAAYETAGVPYL